MTKVFRDEDADLELLSGRTVAVVGYGNQGRSQALNLRDSGVNVVVGSPRDDSYDVAVADGFTVTEIPKAVAEGDIHLLLVPDESMPQIFAESVAPALGDGELLVFASGYNLFYGLLELPSTVDVAMIAPRMIGTGVRETYLRGEGFPSLFSVEQDVSGAAQGRALAVARAIGSTRAGVFASSVEEETVCDLFNEHFGYVYELRRAFEVLTEAGYSPEAVLLEFYASGEEMELARAHAYMGLFHQLSLHSQTSQYGQLVTGKLPAPEEEREKHRLHGLIQHIRGGGFARDWSLERQAGMPQFHRAQQEAMAHALVHEERRLFEVLGRRQGDAQALEAAANGRPSPDGSLEAGADRDPRP
jgi:ketol-acid reductoisomerase